MDMPEPHAPALHRCGTLLCIEGDPTSQALIETLLLAFPTVTLRQAVSGRDGIRAALDEMPDVILLDMNMPDMRGLEVVRVLSERIADGSCQVILLTADKFSLDIVKAMSLGASECWVKPLSPDPLRGRLHRILRTAPAENSGIALSQ